jgi:hypothetical protein
VDFWRFNRVYHKDYVKNRFGRVEILVGIDGVHSMTDLALTRAKLEGIL